MDVEQEISCDKIFLINFIMGMYLGPDVKGETPRRSFFRRLAEALPSYKAKDLGPSFLTFPQVESLYYFLTRNANPIVVFKPRSLHMYLQGKLNPKVVKGPQFTDFCPSKLHKQKNQSSDIIKGVAIIENPYMSCVTPDDVERVSRLTGIQDFKLNQTELELFQLSYQTGNGRSEHNNGEAPVFMIAQHPNEETVQASIPSGGPSNVAFPSASNEKEWGLNSVLTGTATEAKQGPPIGVVDIGVSNDAYLFHVALPGVTRDNGNVSCEIENDGKVHIEGVTSGGGLIKRQGRVFLMMTQHLCPAGPFKISFNLPGPVDPTQFKPTFRKDGILEAVVRKK